MDALGKPSGFRKWGCRHTPGLLTLSLLAGPAHAIHLTAVAPAILLVDQATATDATGAVRSDVRSARLGVPGSTDLGLASDWSNAFGRVLPDSDLAVVALPWRDPRVPAAAQVSFGRRTGVGGALPGNVASSVPSLPGLLDQAAAHFAAQAPRLASRLGEVLKAEGLQEAWFSYRQALSHGGQVQQIGWSLHASVGGTWFASDPAFDGAGGGTLRARYVSLQAARGLPDAVAYRDGGWLVWQLIDPAGNAGDGASNLASDRASDRAGARDTHGAFDTLDGLGCLLGTTRVHCMLQEPGLDVIADQVGATRIELDYLEALRPDYVSGTGGLRVAPLLLQVSRLLESADPRCQAVPLRFVNIFQASFRLQARVDHFVRSLSGRWARSVSAQTLQTSLQPWRTRSVELTPAELPEVSQGIVDPDTGQLTPLSAYPAGIQDIRAGPVECRRPSGLP